MAVNYTSFEPLFAKYRITDFSQVQKAWQEPHRFYHNEEHLAFLLERINKSHFSGTEKEILYLIAFFHNIVYEVTRQDNKQKSAEKFWQMCQADEQIKNLVARAILDTHTHKPSHELSAFFCEIDLAVVRESSFVQLLEWEQKIFKEYQCLDYSLYKPARIQVLRNLKDKVPQNAQNLQYLIEYLQTHKPKIGIYPGSFNPFHNGHYNILQKAEKVFDKVIVARGVNPEKSEFAQNDEISPVLYYRQKESFTGLLTDYLSSKEKDAEITLIRGLRNGDDLAYEMNQINFMKDMKADLKVVFFHCDREFEHISSSAIRNLEKIGKGYGERYLPK
ncbi:MAG: adenylyltransferase/cytidyltransferase family protein [Raineya sp.]|nr:adenylyltransferase/cytidyltransferase family protein [Raineya sp.]MDW8295923.1 adenylyltransferase/cytidyltransferase family protein [Raineya sp.]